MNLNRMARIFLIKTNWIDYRSINSNSLRKQSLNLPFESSELMCMFFAGVNFAGQQLRKILNWQLLNQGSELDFRNWGKCSKLNNLCLTNRIHVLFSNVERPWIKQIY